MASPTYTPAFHDLGVQQVFFYNLWRELDWERREFAPRREYWVNSLDRPYTYGRGVGQRTYFPRPTHPVVQVATLRLEDELGFTYEGCFLNGYEDERDSLGWHSDDDPGINHDRPIAVITLGHGREIQFMEKESGLKSGVFLEPGSLLLMPAGFQQTHLHRIPKVGHKIGPRISLTFRSLLP